MNEGTARPGGNMRPEGMPASPDRGVSPGGTGTPPEGVPKQNWTAEPNVSESTSASVEFTLSSIEKTFRGVREALVTTDAAAGKSAKNNN